MNFFDCIFYHTIKFSLWPIFRMLYQVKAIGLNNIPKKGGILLVGNHSSWLDTLFLTSVMNRPLWFVTGDFIFNVPIMGSLVKHLCVIPMKKNNGKEAIAKTAEKLKEGKLVCIFPEGELTKNGELQRFRNGVAIIQKLSGVPIVPFYMQGAYETWSLGYPTPNFFKKVTLHFGKTFFPKAEKDCEIANEIKEKVEQLL